MIARLKALYGPQLRWEEDSTALVKETIESAAYDDTVIAEALERLSSKHQDFPPSPAAVIATLKEVHRDRLRYAEPPALPEPAAGSLRSHLVKLYGDEGKTITWVEHIKRWHKATNPDGCGGRFCDVCGTPDPKDLALFNGMGLSVKEMSR